MAHDTILGWGAIAAALLVFLWVDLRFFARGRTPSFREAVGWSIGWLVLSLCVGPIIWLLGDSTAAVEACRVKLPNWPTLELSCL